MTDLRGGFTKRRRSDKDRIFAVIVMCTLGAVIVLTGGFIIEKRRLPEDAETIMAVEIIEETNPSTSALTQAAGTTAAPVLSEEPAGTASEAVCRSSGDGLININTADKSELETLTGIGDKISDAIIEYRENTPFEKIEDIMNVKGIGEKKFEDIKDSICV